MNAAPDVNFVRKDGIFVLKDDYLSTIHCVLVNYFQIKVKIWCNIVDGDEQ